MKAIMQKRDHLNGTSTGREAVGNRKGSSPHGTEGHSLDGRQHTPHVFDKLNAGYCEQQ
jgi:hypothetical protein